MITNTRKYPYCLCCGTPITEGRKDRKFCNLKCKNTYNNERHYDITPTSIKTRTLKILNQNYRLLADVMVSNASSVKVGDLVAIGFNPEYSTSFKRGKNGDEIRCFDIKYRQSDMKIFNITNVVPYAKEECNP